VAYLSLKDPLDTHQALLPVYAWSSPTAFYWMLETVNDSRWGLVVV